MCYVVLHFSFVVKVGNSWFWLHFCYDVEYKCVCVQPHDIFKDFRARDTGGISIIDVSVPDKLAFNLTYDRSVCYLILHLHNLSVSEAKFGSLVLSKNIHQIVWVIGLLLLPENCSVWCTQFWYSGHFVSLVLLCQSHTLHCIRSLWAVAHVESSSYSARVKSKVKGKFFPCPCHEGI